MWVKAITTAAIVGVAGTAFAGDHGRGHSREGYYRDSAPAFVYARVVDVDPMVSYVTVDRPRQECWNETVRESNRPYGVAGPTVAGGIIGAAIGRQFGRGDGRDALTLLGAAAGAAVANNRAQRNDGYRDVVVERCQTVSDRVREQRVDGYLVTYVYEGRRYTMQTDSPPGDRIKLAVDVRPVEYRVRY